jgi:hypothetical protein
LAFTRHREAPKRKKIPTDYQNETGFHSASHLSKSKSTGRRHNETCEMNVDAGLHTDTPTILPTGFLDHE